MNEIIGEYKYPLQKMLSEDQILNLRKMVMQAWEGGASSSNQGGSKKEKNFVMCETKA